MPFKNFHLPIVLIIAGAVVSGPAAAETACETDALISAARSGDRGALVRLADMNAKGDACAPRLDTIVGIETALAESGDPVMSWRLARRYETGDGVAASTHDMIYWLEKTANSDDRSYPKVAEAAYRLCQVYGGGFGAPSDERKAGSWCRRAAADGYPAAALALARLEAGR